MELNIPERILLLQLLPKTGRWADVQSVIQAREIFILRDEELRAIDYKVSVKEDGNPNETFNEIKAKEYVKDLPVTQWVADTIRASLAKLEKESKLPLEMSSLYEKFIINYE